MQAAHITRRRFLQGTALTATAAAVTVGGTRTAHATDPHRWFQHGVASGDPTPGSVILWTRVTPTPEATPGSGVGEPVGVVWEVAREASISTVVARGTVVTGPERDHTVHVDPGGLEPGTRYYYRFTAPDGERSPVGTTTTLPLIDAPLSSLTLAVASCANWEAGHFAAFGDIARRAGELDLVVFLGDYIYEYARGAYVGGAGMVRATEPAEETIRLDQYRTRYGLHRTDPDLQAAHAALPWIVMWDDHETANNSWRDGAQNHQPHEGPWHDRKQAARQAYLEWLPIRAGSSDLLYRSFTFGTLGQLSMLDLRSFRDAPPTHQQWLGGMRGTTMMGTAQFDWLKTQVENTTARWNIIGSSVMFAPMQVTGGPHIQLPDPLPANLDQWDGYSRERDRLLSVLADTGRPSLFLTGDIHSEWGSTLRHGDRHIGVELVGSSITSANVNDFLGLPEDNPVSHGSEGFIRANAPHVRHVDLDAHGYAIATLGPESVQLRWLRVADITLPNSPVAPAVALDWVYGTGFTS